MSIIQKIQDKGAWIISILIGIALIAFIMMDYSKGGSMFSNTSTIGKVNGYKIPLADFNDKVSMASQMQNNQNAPREAIEENVWNYYVQTTLLQQAFDQLGLVSNSRDLNNSILNNPTPELKQSFTDPQTGQYDGNRALNVLNEIKRKGTAQQKGEVAKLIDEINQNVLVGKYQTLLIGGVYVPTWLAEKQNADNNAIAKVSYVTVPYSTISDSAVKVTDEDIDAYVAAHKKQFEQKDATRSISVVNFNAAASAADSAVAYNALQNLKNDFINTPNDSAFVAAKGSDIPYTNEYISATQMQQKQLPFAEALNTPVDSTYGPYPYTNVFVLAKMVSKISMADSVKFRHILVATAQQDPQTGQLQQTVQDSDAVKRLDSAIAAIKAGASFDSIALKYSNDPGSANKGGVYDYIPSGQMVPEINDFLFTGKTGDTKIIKSVYGYHYVEILGQKGTTEGYKIAAITKSLDPSQTTIDSVDNVASSFVAANSTQKAFEENAKKQNISILPVNGLRENDYNIGNIGVSRELVKWSYAHKIGEVSQPVHIGTNVVVATLTGITKPGLPDANTVRQYVQPILANRKKAKIIIDSKFKGNTLESYAQSSGSTIVTIDSVSFQTAMIPNVGYEPKVAGVAFNKTLLGKVSAPVAGNSGVFGIQPLSISAKSSLDGGPEQLKVSIKQSWIQQLQRGFIDALMKNAKIDDYRSKFF
ncbi:MAG: SurA N-terminal domain-containing protein [Arachidicoccus sp.]|nr:SurA N-terminal domain-containing protein [Arachidicoccus sp.]